MNWNFLANDYLLRLPVAEHDQSTLLEFLGQADIAAHIPRLALVTSAQVDNELRRMAERFQAREAAFWLIENVEDKLVARVSVQGINWLQRSAQLVWELSPALSLNDLQQFMPKLFEFCTQELGLHRLEMRLRADARQQEWLQGLGFVYEGTLPAQLEFQGENIDLEVWSYLKRDVLVRSSDKL